MAWYRLAFRPSIVQDLATVDSAMAQRLLEKIKWLASNVGNLRHEALASDLPGLSKYAVGDWRIFYTIDRTDQMLHVHGIIHRKDLA